MYVCACVCVCVCGKSLLIVAQYTVHTTLYVVLITEKKMWDSQKKYTGHKVYISLLQLTGH